MVPDDETREWIFQSAGWWIASFGGFENLAQTALVTPTEEDFPVDIELEDHQLAEDYFAFVVEHAGLSEWPFLLVPENPGLDLAEILRGMPHHLTSAPVSHGKPAPLGEGDPLFVPYAASQIAEPIDLVATMARGVSHYLLYEASDPLPADADDREYLVDLGAVFLGFGIFLANSAFRFFQRERGAMIGWGYSRGGALSELDVSYALALFAALLELPDRDVVPHLRPNPRGYFGDARKDITRRRKDDLRRLRATPAPSGGPYR